jgi:F420H(2)-dependent biliverdin reductase
VKTPTAEGLEFVRERHLATLSTIAPWGGIHSVPVGFTLADGIVRIITSRRTQKVRNLLRHETATVSQVVGAQWITVQGTAKVSTDADEIAHAVELYAERYRQPRVNPERVAILLTPTRWMGSAGLVG